VTSLRHPRRPAFVSHNRPERLIVIMLFRLTTEKPYHIVGLMLRIGDAWYSKIITQTRLFEFALKGELLHITIHSNDRCVPLFLFTHIFLTWNEVTCLHHREASIIARDEIPSASRSVIDDPRGHPRMIEFISD